MKKQELDWVLNNFTEVMSNKDTFWNEYVNLLNDYKTEINAMLYMAVHDGELSEIPAGVKECALNLTRYEYKFLKSSTLSFEQTLDTFYTMARFRYYLPKLYIEDIKKSVTYGVEMGLNDFENTNKENNDNIFKFINNKQLERRQVMTIPSVFIEEMKQAFTTFDNMPYDQELNALINKLDSKVQYLDKEIEESDKESGCDTCRVDDCALAYCNHYITQVGINTRYRAAYELLSKLREIKEKQSMGSEKLDDIKKKYTSMYGTMNDLDEINKLFNRIESTVDTSKYNSDALEKFLLEKQLVNADEILYELEAKANKAELGSGNVYKIMFDNYKNYISDGTAVIDNSFLAHNIYKDNSNNNNENNSR
ncbi:MAG: hypothetical protein RR334_01105 [Clostridia bacterium]